nr:unnamed protein product [Digitaria exilis]
MSASRGATRRRAGSVALGDLLRREASAERAEGGERPTVAAGQAGRAKKGEDLALLKPACERRPGAPSTSFSAFALFDGHNGSGAAVYAKEHLLGNVLSCVPTDLSRDDWLAALPRALVAGFVKTDKDFQTKAHSSGTTVTLVIIDGSVVTVASVGDSRCVLEAEGSIFYLSADHRFDASEEEVGRVTECGGEVGRLNVVGGAEIGPLRCWPGGLCLSRSIGDQDVGEFIIPVPYVKQMKLSNSGGRLIIASDGVWDALTAEMAFSCARGLSPEPAADQIVKVRLNSEYPVRDMFKLFACAICQVDLESGQGISIHEGLSKPGKLRPWDGPFLCHSCQEKKEAMEGKRHSRGINLSQFYSMNFIKSSIISNPIIDITSVDSSSRNSGSSE